jgi:type VII secretion integral membrane protein EccD
MGGMTDSIAEPFRHEQGGGFPGDLAGPDGFAAGQANGAASAQTQSEADGEAGPQSPGSDVCRLTVYGPESSVELAVPVHVPLVDLLPALASHLGGNLADAGLEHGGWVLQRIGDRPLREELSTAALGLHDGDVVYLRPRSAQLPPADFDDLIDGVATGIANRTDRWRPDLSRRLLTGLLAVPLAAAGGLLAAGQPGSRGVAIAAVLALLALVSAGIASRAFGDRNTARLLGMAAMGYAAIAGSQLPLLHGGTGLLGRGNGPGATLLAAAAAATALALLAAMLTGGGDPVFTALIAISGLAAAAGTFWAFLPVGRPQVAAVMLVLVAPLGALVPVLSFRLAGMRLDPLPTTPDELQTDLDPVPGEHVLERTHLADRYMGALYTALGIVAGICLAVLGQVGGLRADLVAIDAIVLLLLHARLMVAARQKLAAVVPAVTGAAILITVAGLRASPHTRMLLVSGATVAAGLLWAGQRTLPGRKLVPIWGRIGDLLESLAALALLPATLWLLNLFALVRAVRL